MIRLFSILALVFTLDASAGCRLIEYPNSLNSQTVIRIKGAAKEAKSLRDCKELSTNNTTLAPGELIFVLRTDPYDYHIVDGNVIGVSYWKHGSL